MKPLLRFRWLNFASWILAAFALAGWFKFLWPVETSRGILLYAARFYGVVFFLCLSLFGLGQGARKVLARSDFPWIDLAVGFGFFAFFLNIYIKITLNPVLPVFILILGVARAGWVWHKKWENFLEWIKSPYAPGLVFVLGAVLLDLSFQNGGLLFFPADFDSGLFHVTFPSLVAEVGHYFNPDWLRSPWLPQLTHQWYIFILSVLNVFFLKTLNAVCLIQLMILFVAFPRWPQRILGAFIFATVAAAPEFRNVLVSTSIDAVFCMLSVSMIAVFVRFWMDSKTLSAQVSSRNFFLLMILAGFTSGQKHFGIMFSVPVLGLSFLRYGLSGVGRWKIPEFRVRLKFLGAMGLLYLVIFLPFYLHNPFAGAHLFFPFLGAKPAYGWNAADLTQMITDTIPHWGHSKTVFGYFMLPLHLMRFSAEYQFSRNHDIYDMLTSVGILFSFGFLFAWTTSGMWRAFKQRRWKTSDWGWLALIYCLQVMFWYKGSQVIRYLVPVTVGSFYFFIQWINSKGFLRRSENGWEMIFLSCMALGLAIFQLRPQMYRSTYPVVYKKEDIVPWFKRFVSPGIGAYQWILENGGKKRRILNIGDVIFQHQFPELALCGDWFGQYRYSNYLVRNQIFKEWSQIAEDVSRNDFTYLVIDWNFFASSGMIQPEGILRQTAAFPTSVSRCLAHLYFDGEHTDIYEFRSGCKIPELIPRKLWYEPRL